MDGIVRDIAPSEVSVATALELLLISTNLLTPENSVVIQSYPKPNQLFKALKSLQNEGILTQESFDEIQLHQKPEIAAKVLKLLHKAGILTPENRTIIQLDSEIRTRTNAQSIDIELQGIDCFLAHWFLDEFYKLAPYLKLAAIASNIEIFYSAKILTQENLDILRLHSEPYKIKFLFTSLHQSKILTQKNLDAVYRHADLDLLNEIFGLLDKGGILTQENFDNVLSHSNLKLLSRISKLFYMEGMLTQINLEVILPDTGLLSVSSVAALNFLYNATLFTQENVETIRQYKKKTFLPFIELLLSLLYKEKILTQKYFELILAHPDPVSLYMILDNLKDEGMLNKENFEAIIFNYSSELSIVANAFSSLCAAGILTQENIEAIQFHAAPIEFLDLFKRLHNSSVLTQKNFEIIRLHPHSTELIRMLKTLSNIGILNQVNLEKAQSLPDLQSLVDAIFTLYRADILTQESFIALFKHKILLMPWIWNRIPEQTITLETFNVLLQRAGQVNPEKQVSAYLDYLLSLSPINDEQSTHTASVHYSVSESAIRLDNRYGSFTEDSLKRAIMLVDEYLSDDYSVENKAAKRCIGRIISSDCAFLDPISGISLQQLFFLVIFATTDKNNQYGSKQDAINRLIEGLYEIQRGNNLSEKGEDDGEEDDPICGAGAFNKLIEKLQGIHPDCEINFVTSKTASLKLPIIVRETALQYLSSLANPANIADFLTFTRLIQQIKTQGIEVIWNKINEPVMNKMFNEFYSLYKHQENKALIDLVAAGLDTTLTDKTLNSFQEKIQNSSGYHQYCSQMLHQNHLFYSSMIKNSLQNNNFNTLKDNFGFINSDLFSNTNGGFFRR